MRRSHDSTESLAMCGAGRSTLSDRKRTIPATSMSATTLAAAIARVVVDGAGILRRAGSWAKGERRRGSLRAPHRKFSAAAKRGPPPPSGPSEPASGGITTNACAPFRSWNAAKQIRLQSQRVRFGKCTDIVARMQRPRGAPGALPALSPMACAEGRGLHHTLRASCQANRYSAASRRGSFQPRRGKWQVYPLGIRSR